jgi:Cu/Ag efflux protein CusF
MLCVIALVAPTSAHAQSRDTAQARDRPSTGRTPAADPAEPCCNVVGISAEQGIVTARETATGYTFRFHVRDQATLAGIKVGDAVWANLTAGTVKLRRNDSEPCCSVMAAPARP